MIINGGVAFERVVSDPGAQRGGYVAAAFEGIHIGRVEVDSRPRGDCHDHVIPAGVVVAVVDG